MTSTMIMVLVLLAVYLVGVFAVYFILSFFAAIVRFIRNTVSLSRQRELERAFLKKQMIRSGIASELAEKNISLEKQIVALKKDLKDKETDLNQKLSSLTKEINNSKKREAADSASLKERSDAYVKQMAQLQEKYDKILTANETMTEQAARLRIKYEVAAATLETLRSEIKEADQRQNNQETGLAKGMQEALEKLKNEKKQLEDALKQQLKELSDLKAIPRQESIPKESWKPAEPPADTTPEIQKNGSWQAWVHRFTLGHLGERIWITKGEFEDVEEEIKKKDGHAKKYSDDLQETEHKVA